MKELFFLQHSPHAFMLRGSYTEAGRYCSLDLESERGSGDHGGTSKWTIASLTCSIECSLRASWSMGGTSTSWEVWTWVTSPRASSWPPWVRILIGRRLWDCCQRQRYLLSRRSKPSDKFEPGDEFELPGVSVENPVMEEAALSLVWAAADEFPPVLTANQLTNLLMAWLVSW